MRFLRRFGPSVVAVAVTIAAIAGLVWRPQTVTSAHRASYVIIAGAPGLRWDDVTEENTPTLWAMARKDAIAAMSVRSAHDPTCPVDGWLTLGAGNYARRLKTPVDVCPGMRVPLREAADGRGANISDQELVVPDNRALAFGTQPGALAGATRCTTAVGTGAAVAAARPYGRVDWYKQTLPADPRALLRECPLSIVDLGTVDGRIPATRAAQAHAVDNQLAAVLAGRPANSLVLVAGVSDTDSSERLHVALADGPGYDGGWLTSSSTGRAGYIQLVDLAPTALAALGLPEPSKLFIGEQVQRVGTRSADPARAIASLADADREADVQHHVSGLFFGAFVGLTVLLLICTIPLLRRARRSAEPHGPPPVSPRIVRYAEALLVAASLTIVAALLTDIIPWWRWSSPGVVFTLLGAAVTAILVVITLTGPWRHGTLPPLIAVTTIIVAVLGLDVVAGSHLQLNGVAGYSAVSGARYSGMGPIGLGAFIAAILLLGGCAAHYVPSRRWRPVAVAVIGALGIIIVGSPQLGADPGGAVAMTAGVCVAAAVVTGGWLSFGRLLWATLAGLAVLIGFAVLDLRRPVAQRGSLGQFLTEFHQGTAGIAMQQTAVNDVVATLTNPVSLFVVVSIIYTVFVLNRPWGGLMRVFGLYAGIRGAMTGMAVASILGGLIDGAGFRTPGAAAAVALPLVTLAALRVLDHADDRSVGPDVARRGVPAPETPADVVPARPAPPGAGLGRPQSAETAGETPGSAAALPDGPGTGTEAGSKTGESRGREVRAVPRP